MLFNHKVDLSRYLISPVIYRRIYDQSGAVHDNTRFKKALTGEILKIEPEHHGDDDDGDHNMGMEEINI